MYKGSYSVPENGSERLNTFEGMYRLADYWSLGNSDLFNDLTLKLIDSIGTRTYDRCASSWPRIFFESYG